MRVFILIFAAALLSWYSRQGGNNPFAGTKTIRLAGDKSGYTLICGAGKTQAKRVVTLFAPVTLSSSDNKQFQEELSGEWDLVTLSQAINFHTFPHPPQSWTILSPQSTQISVDNVKTAYDNWPEPIFNTQAGMINRFFWQIVYPFSDNAHAVLLTVDKTTTLVCDSSVFAHSSIKTRSQFKEKLDLLIIPSADAQTVKEMREIFRPRFVAVMPPCGIPAGTNLQNIICAEDGESWEYRFKVKRGKLKAADLEYTVF